MKTFPLKVAVGDAQIGAWKNLLDTGILFCILEDPFCKCASHKKNLHLWLESELDWLSALADYYIILYYISNKCCTVEVYSSRKWKHSWNLKNYNKFQYEVTETKVKQSNNLMMQFY